MFKYGFTYKNKNNDTQNKIKSKNDKLSELKRKRDQIILQNLHHERNQRDIETLNNIYTYVQHYKYNKEESTFEDLIRNYLNDFTRIERFNNLKEQGLITNKHQNKKFFQVDLWN